MTSSRDKVRALSLLACTALPALGCTGLQSQTSVWRCPVIINSSLVYFQGYQANSLTNALCKVRSVLSILLSRNREEAGL